MQEVLLLKGVVTRFDPMRKFGFIVSSEVKEEIFFHLTGVSDGYWVVPGNAVEFTAVPDSKRDGCFKAINIQPAKEGSNV